MGGVVWGVVWGGLGWFRVCAPPLLPFVFSLGILVWELHFVAPEEAGLRLVWPGLWWVSLGLLNKNMFSNNLLIYHSFYKYVK